MNAAGENWTLSSFEAVNFGSFVGDSKRAAAISTRIIAEAKRLGVKEVAVVECGTAFRVLKQQIGELGVEIERILDLA